MIDHHFKSSSASGNPEDAIAEFFDQYGLRQSKNMLWDWYKATTTCNYADLTKIERENIATFYERVHNLLNAVHSLKVQEDK